MPTVSRLDRLRRPSNLILASVGKIGYGYLVLEPKRPGWILSSYIFIQLHTITSLFIFAYCLRILFVSLVSGSASQSSKQSMSQPSGVVTTARIGYSAIDAHHD